MVCCEVQQSGEALQYWGSSTGGEGEEGCPSAAVVEGGPQEGNRDLLRVSFLRHSGGRGQLLQGDLNGVKPSTVLCEGEDGYVCACVP